MGAPVTLPPEYELAVICERFHVLPSQVLAEDFYIMRRVVSMLGERDRIARERQKKKHGRK